MEAHEPLPRSGQQVYRSGDRTTGVVGLAHYVGAVLASGRRVRVALSSGHSRRQRIMLDKARISGHYKYVMHNGRRYLVVGKDGLIWVPDPVEVTEKKMTTHAKVSYIKSTWRIFGFFFLLISLPLAVGCLILAELVGIYEEFGC
jgi:hypothetical protein